MTRKDRLLSGFLAASLCFSLASPAALATNNGPVVPFAETTAMTLKANGSTTLNQGDTTRLYVDNVGSSAIMGVNYSTVDGIGKIKIDTDGRVTLAPNYTPTADEKVTVTASVSYYDGENVSFVENFEENNIVNLKFPGVGSTNSEYTLLDKSSDPNGLTAYTGTYGVTMKKDDLHHNTNRRADLDAAQTGLLTFWYYDDYNDVDNMTHSAFGLFLNAAKGSNNPPAINFFGVAHHGVGMSTQGSRYGFRTSGSAWTHLDNDANAVRSKGWHKLQYKVEETGTTLYIDDKQVGPVQTSLTSISSIGLGTNNGSNNGDGPTSPNGYHFIDDISLVTLAAANDSSKRKTANVTLQLDLIAPAVSGPIDAVLIGEEGPLTSTGADKLRLDTKGSNYVIDEIVSYTYDDTKLDINNDGIITLKSGYAPATEETTDVVVEYTYFSGDDVKYVENLDDNTARPFVEEKNPGSGYAINDGNSRTGLYGATFGANKSTATDASIKALTAPVSDVVVTAWYFDPYDQKDLDHAAAFPDGEKGQVKYGFGVSNGTTAKAHYLLGLFYNSTKNNAADGSATKYGYRMAGGNFNASTVTRSSGWHELSWNVDSIAGTTRYIDGIKIDEAPIADIKSVSTLMLSTNWQNTSTSEGRDLIMDRHYIDDISIVAATATPTTSTATVSVAIAANTASTEPSLTYGLDNSGALSKGETGRVYLDNMGDYTIANVTYTTDNENVSVTNGGILAVKEGYIPKTDETVTVKAAVTYYDKPEDVIFSESFEADKLFTAKDAAGKAHEGAYAHSSANPLFGRSAATSTKTNGYPQYDIPAVSNVTVTAWYHDNAGGEGGTPGSDGQVKFGFGINTNVKGNNAMGVFYDGSIAPIVNNITRTNYGMRIPGYTYNNYAWGGSDAPRSRGWHKLEWVIDEVKGMTAKIDGKIVSTHTLVGTTETNHTLVPVKEMEAINSLTGLMIMGGWNNNGDNQGAIIDKYFIDGVTVTKNTATTAVETLTSVAIPVLDVQYDHTPENPVVDSKYPEDLVIDITPDLNELGSVKLDGKELADAQWSHEYDTGPSNALYYPKAWRVTVTADTLKGLTEGAHKLTLVMTSGSVYDVPFTAKANTHVAQKYYLSNTGSDTNTGHTPAQAWASFDQLSTVTFGPGDAIYLDAESIWSAVQFQPKGSGAPGAPIILTKYNDGGDPSKRPILNGDGTAPDKVAHSYLAFTAWRGFYPSGTVELFNVEHWEVTGLEITNYTTTVSQDGTGRNGIAVIYDYFETQGITTLSSSNQVREEAFYEAGKLDHIVIEDCYIHDVYGYHPGNGGLGKGSKMSGGINAYGPYDNMKIDKNIIMYCDVEGIRNDVLAWMGDTATQFPHYMEGISISDNFIVGVPGDGVVISSAIEPRLANNYLSDAGYSYIVDGSTTSANVKPMGNRNNPVVVSNSLNYAGLWFIGTLDAVAEFNESVNNVWTCQDGEAFDADMYCRGTVFQYNYTYRNNGGLCLLMGSMYNGTILRYNISVADGEGLGSADGKKAIFYYNGAPEAIYNNLFIVGENVKSMFGGGAKQVNFYNNMVISPTGRTDFILSGNGSSDTTNMERTGEIKNNLFYPQAILDGVTGSVVLEDNIAVATAEELPFYDLDAFMAAQPIHALNGRSPLTGTVVDGLSLGKGAGVAISAAAGRSVKVPDGTGFDYTLFEGIKTVEGAATIGTGIPVVLAYAPTDEIYPLTHDFFKNDITGMTNPDIGPYQWAADPGHFVTLTYESNDTTAPIEAQLAQSGETYELPTPEKVDHKFLGWYDNAELTGTPVNQEYVAPAVGITLYAKWAALYTVTFDAQGGSDVISLDSVQSGTTIIAPTEPNKAEYAFDGWYKDSTCSNVWNFEQDTVTADTTLFAKWVDTHTVSFDSQGGSEVNSIYSVKDGTSVAAPTAPTKENYSFAGWYKESSCTNLWSFSNDKVTSDITLYAKWSTDTFSVVFDSQGGSVVDPVYGLLSGATVEEPTAPTKKGYSFDGWYEESDCIREWNFVTGEITHDITLYAKWDETYTVIFDTQGGSNVDSVHELQRGAMVTEPTAPTKNLYTFEGWYKESSCTNAWNFATDKVTANTSLFAKWAGHVYTVTFDKNGGDENAAPNTITVTVPATTLETLPTAPSRSGYTFTSWNTKADGSGTSFIVTTAVTVDVTVYAQWSYNGGGSSGGSSGSGGGSGTPIVPPMTPEKPAENVTATEGGKVNTTTNKDGSVAYDFKPEAGQKVLYVRVNGIQVPVDKAYTAKKGETPSIVAIFGDKVTAATETFDDVVKLPDYAQTAITYVTSAGLFNGMGEKEFSPDTGMNRAMFATVMGRLYGADMSKYSATDSKFGDVKMDAWYGPSVTWATEIGLTNGVGDGQFAPERDMTRQELVTLVHRFAVKVGVNTSAAKDLTQFADADSLAPWATEAMVWAVGLGLINGRGTDLAPQETITRAEAAIILERMSTLLVMA